MSTGSGIIYTHSAHTTHHEHTPNTTTHLYRQVQILHYINWLITSPLLLTAMAFLSGLPGAYLLPAVASDMGMFVAGIFGTFAVSDSSSSFHPPGGEGGGSGAGVRWVWLAISSMSYLITIYMLGMHGQRAANASKPDEGRRFYGGVAGTFLVVKAGFLVYVLPPSPVSFSLGLSFRPGGRVRGGMQLIYWDEKSSSSRRTGAKNEHRCRNDPLCDPRYLHSGNPGILDIDCC